jgi:hypothetical protein
MIQQSPEQKNADISAESERAYGVVPKKVRTPGFEPLDAGYTQPRANLNPKTDAYENGVVDAPAGRNATEVRADAKQDANPIRKATLLNTDQDRDE